MFALGDTENNLIKTISRYYNSKKNDSPEDNTIYSVDYIRKLYKDPNENIDRVLVEMPLKNDDDENEDDLSRDRRCFYEYLKHITDVRSKPAKYWTALHHLLCYVYRSCRGICPNIREENFHNDFNREMHRVVRVLQEDDRCQLALKIFSTLREYTTFAAKKHETISRVEASIESLFYYYEAFLSATKTVCNIFPDIEKYMLDTYKLGWLDFNTSIFMYYFYETAHVQKMLKQFEPMKDDVSLKAAGIYTVLTELHKLWKSQLIGINSVFRSNGAAKPKIRTKELKYLPVHVQLLQKSYWVDRNRDSKEEYDIYFFEHELHLLVGDKTLSMPDPMLDEYGNCICEECLLISYNYFITGKENPLPDGSMRVSCTRYCKELVSLDEYQLHISAHVEDSRNEKMKVRNNRKVDKKTERKVEKVSPAVAMVAAAQAASISAAAASITAAANSAALENALMDRIPAGKVAEYVADKVVEKMTERVIQEVDVADYPQDVADIVVKRTSEIMANTSETATKKVTEKIVGKVVEYMAEKVAERISEDGMKNKPLWNNPKFRALRDRLRSGKAPDIFLEALKEVGGRTVERILENMKNDKSEKTMPEILGEEAAKMIWNRKDDAEKINHKNQIQNKPANSIYVETNGNLKSVGTEVDPEFIGLSEAFDLDGATKIVNGIGCVRKNEWDPASEIIENIGPDVIDLVLSTGVEKVFENKIEHEIEKVLKKQAEDAIKKNYVTKETGACSRAPIIDANGKNPKVDAVLKNGGCYERKLQNNSTKSKKTKGVVKQVENVIRCERHGFEQSSRSRPHHRVPNPHSCKLEEELKTEFQKAYQEACDHHRDSSKKCDCTFCESTHSLSKCNETRNRLRIRLNQRNEKKMSRCAKVRNAQQQNKVEIKDPHPHQQHYQQQQQQQQQQQKDQQLKEDKKEFHTCDDYDDNKKGKDSCSVSVDDTNSLLNEIHGILNYIEGNTGMDKMQELAEKKAAKKARQREKKEQERLRLEEEEKEKAKKTAKLLKEKREAEERESTKKEAERLKKETQFTKQTNDKTKKDKKKKKDKNEEIIEEIPAIVTIKRRPNGDTPDFIITLKSSSQDQYKLLYNLLKHDEKIEKIEENNGIINKKATINNTNKSNDSNNINNNTNKKNKNKSKVEVVSTVTPPISVPDTRKDKKSKKKQEKNNKMNDNKENSVVMKEVKVTLAVNTSNGNNNNNNNKHKQDVRLKDEKKELKKDGKKTEDINIPMLKLPPGITITKVDGPMTDRNYKGTDNPTYNSNIPVSKSGVIVVDTEKLIKQSTPSSSSSSSLSKTGVSVNSVNSSENKKNKNKKQVQQTLELKPKKDSKSSMVTLKNPIFQSMQSSQQQQQQQNYSHFNKYNHQTVPIHMQPQCDQDLGIDLNGTQQASIFKNENGMVTIRSSRLQQSLNGCPPLGATFLPDLRPLLGPEVVTASLSTPTPPPPPPPHTTTPPPPPPLPSLSSSTSLSLSISSKTILTKTTTTSAKATTTTTNNQLQQSRLSQSIPSTSSTLSFSDTANGFNTFNAQEILSGLPGIEITKVDKNFTKYDNDKRSHTAEVSIIPSNGSNSFIDDDWIYDSVFKPKDYLDDDMDAEERELEAFKRFCQQSVPPKYKEKVTHLNVKDIVLLKHHDKHTG